MKNLKKVFAVVLVVAMAFSLMAVASAKSISDYSDASSITQKEAVTILTAAGVLAGTDTGAFNPTGTFTREQAAKVITYILVGAEAGDKLKATGSSFADVAATRWSAPYIQYCASRGVINGDGTGNFNPEAAISGTQFAKLLLTSLGLGRNGEYIGANWEINVLTDAVSRGILTLNVDYTATATREQVAQYALNALPMRLQVYDKTTDEYINTATPSFLCDKLGLSQEESVSNGVSGYYWVLNGDRIGFYGNEKVIATGTNGKTIAAYTTVGNTDYKATLASTVDYYYNGTLVPVWAAGATNAANTLIVIGNTLYEVGGTALTGTETSATILSAVSAAPAFASGVIVNFLSTNTDSKAEVVSIIEKSIATVSAAPVVLNGEVTIPGVSAVSSISPDLVKYPADLAKGDVVLYYTGEGGVVNVQKATKLTGTVTAANLVTAGTPNTYTLTIADVKHGLTGLAGPMTTSDFATFAETSGNFNVAVTAWLDDNGNIISISTDGAVSASNYLLVSTHSTDPVSRAAKVVKADGTTAIVTVGLVGVSPTAFPVDGTVYSYTVGSNNEYNLTAAANQISDTGATIANTVTFSGTDKANANTVFVVANTVFGGAAGTYRVVTGVSNLPASISTADYSGALTAAGGPARIVFITSGASAGTPEYVYLINPNSYSTSYPSAGVVNYTYKAIVDGAQKDVVMNATAQANVTTAVATANLIKVTYDGNNVINSVDAITSGALQSIPADAFAGTAGTSTAANGGLFTTDGSNAFSYNDSTVVFYISTTGVVTQTTPSAITADTGANDKIVAQFTASVVDSADLLSYIYIQVVANP
ncbi:S-layer homology domain-containing protein [Sporobacter termitidis DSM 10068]|uniref:S-layer homology domain-containing protein n=1 Tax=Sporobacter termitidis DSM 10068 TaxID=1123282 RepID=A0A1M5XYQ7_9FIRM|nr:S-layer homology domain-containing protein [Sporobacter termitidis]SHI04393.1 S-layer homology domain-containing protein [Sporobacter termitidis DSM 10068]